MDRRDLKRTPGRFVVVATLIVARLSTVVVLVLLVLCVCVYCFIVVLCCVGWCCCFLLLLLVVGVLFVFVSLSLFVVGVVGVVELEIAVLYVP